MINIEISPGDRDDMLKLLDYALEKKKKDKSKTSYYKFWELRVPQLKKLISGQQVYAGIFQSSLGGCTNEIIEGLANDSYSKKTKN